MSVDIYYFDYSTATSEPPTSSQVRIDAVSPYAAASKLWIRYLTNDGLDVFYSLGAVAVGSVIGVQDKNEHARGVRFTVTGAPVDKVGYFEIPVVRLDVGSLDLANNQAVAVTIAEPVSVEPPEPVPGAPLDFYHATSAAGLVSLAVAKEHLKIYDTTHDDEVTRFLKQASDVILDYLKHGADPSWTADTVPLPVQAAVLYMLAHLYADRGDRAKDTDADADATVWEAIDRLLARFRDPALA